MNKVLMVDFNRCIYCHACEDACMREHDGHSFIRVMLLRGSFPIPVRCHHCRDAPCIRVCPTGALRRNEHNVVVVDEIKCIGCRLCAMVCPFGMLELDTASKVMVKCDLCQHRLEEGKEPACVVVCPARAFTYDEFDSIMEQRRGKVSRAIVEGKEIGTEYKPIYPVFLDFIKSLS